MDEYNMYPYDQSYEEMKETNEYNETLTEYFRDAYYKSLWDKVLNKD